MNKDTFCVMPWIGANIGNAGQLTPCCAYDEDASLSFDKQSHHIRNFKTWKINLLDSVRQELLDGVKHAGCHRCWEIEEAGAKSPLNKEPVGSIQLSERQFYNNHFGGDLDSFNLLDIAPLEHLSIAFGNTCNLRCNMCGPYSSSSWNTEIKQNFSILNPLKHPINDNEFLWYESEDFKNLTPSLIANLRYVRLIGGEPLFTPEAIAFLEQLSPLVYLNIVTNATLLKDSVYKLLSKFKQIDIMVSVEGIGGHNDYVRYGSKWETIDANIQRLNTLLNIEYFNIGYILQHYSYYTLIPVLQYCVNHAHIIRVQTVTWHDYLEINTLMPAQVTDLLEQIEKFIVDNPVLTTVVRGQDTPLYITHLNSAIEYIKTVLTSQYAFNENNRSKFFEFTRSVDSIRKITFDQAFLNK
jgi:sulfatase maturation enzyme AslB (radical SAM superfamily)